MLKVFLSFDEATAELGVDYTELRQAYETGLARGLPAYVYCGDVPLLACLTGGQASRDEYGDPRVVLPNGNIIADPFLETPEGAGDLSSFDLGDDLGDVSLVYATPHEKRYPACFELRGFFRVRDADLKDAARSHDAGRVRVAPYTWWLETHHPGLGFSTGRPGYFFRLLPAPSEEFRDPPRFCDLYFRVADVRAFVANHSRNTNETTVEAALDARERNNLLRIIRALDVMAKLPERGAVASVERQLEELGFSHPGEATIRKALKDARALDADGKPQ